LKIRALGGRSVAARRTALRVLTSIVLALVLCLPGVAFCASTGARVALVVSVSRYDNLNDLDNPQRDALLIGQRLEHLGFKVERINDPSRIDLLDALTQFQATAHDADAAIVYFAGHGAEIDGTNYLLPHDARANSKAMISGTGLESERFRQAVLTAKKLRLIILDACRNNPAGGRAAGGTGGLARESGGTASQVVTLMAAGPGKEAMDGDGVNSPFARALADGLGRQGMTAGELPRFVQLEVERETENQQSPDLQGIWLETFWTFDANAPLATVSVNPAAAAQAKTERDRVFWQSIKDSTDPADFRSYVEEADRGAVPGQFRKLAVNRLNVLASPAKSVPAMSATAFASMTRARAAFRSGDLETAQREWKNAASQGDGAAMYNLGVLALTGRGRTRDLGEAVVQFKTAAETGHVGGMINYGLCLLNGFGVAKNPQTGLGWLSKAADLGSGTAMGMLGEAALSSEWGPADPAKAAGWLQRAVQAGDGPANTRLADLYERGDGVRADLSTAMTLYRRGAAAGDSDAMVRLGYHYEDGQGAPRDLVQAATWYQQAAEAGNAEGMSSLGVMFETGQGVPKDLARAASYYGQAAQRRDVRGMLGLGTLLARGDGVARDPVEAARFFKSAAEAGSAAAMRNLGVLYEAGDGVPRDLRRAAALYQQAAAQGDEASSEALQRLSRTNR